MNQEAALPYFPLLPGHPQALAGGAGPAGLAAATVIACSCLLSVLSTPCAEHTTPIVSFISTALLFTLLGRRGN